MGKWMAGSSFLLAMALFAPVGRAAVVWNEAVNGSLSSSGAAPTAITLATGTNSVIGTVGGGSNQDWVALTVPAGDELSSVMLASYSSTDAQGFTGVQAGTAFIGSSNSAGSYLGYTHFGTGATNGTLGATNLIGADLLPLMGNNASNGTAPGSQGFSPPLGSGSYVFLIQQLGATTSYQFDYDVTAVPEPASLAVVGAGAALLLGRRAGKGRRGR